MIAYAGSSEAFFLDSAPGQRFCLFFSPTGNQPCRGAVLYLAPFAEEMNKSRRLAAHQARLLASHGYAVLLMDVYGCGDSSGDFADARWTIWKRDLRLAAAWLRQRIDAPLSLLGLRLGALMAIELAAELRLQRLVLWQPVVQGAAYLTQFLRLRLTADLLTAPEHNTSGATGTDATRRLLAQGETVEIAGYPLAPALAAELEELDARQWQSAAPPVFWLECLNEATGTVAPARKKIADDWRKQGADLQLIALRCPPFWASPEICSAPALLEATLKIFCPAEGSGHGRA